MQEWTYLRQKDTTRTRQVDTPKESRTFITAGDPCICPVNHLFCVRNHENENGPDLGLVRSLDEAGNARVRVHARNVLHEAESSRPTRSCCADDTAPGTPDDLCRHTHSGRHDHRADRRPCASEVEAAMASGCHLARGAASPEGNGAIGMVNDCHLARPGRGESRLK